MNNEKVNAIDEENDFKYVKYGRNVLTFEIKTKEVDV